MPEDTEPVTTLIAIRLTCPVCGTSFSSQAIGSTNRVSQDTDFRPRSIGLDPLPHYVHVCPQCCFAAYQGDFEDTPDAVRQAVLTGRLQSDHLLRGEARGALKGSSKYLLAARCYQHHPGADDLQLADLFLSASWCSRDENRPDRERQCQTEAVLHFEAAIDASSIEPAQLATILYLVGELYRRLGLFEVSISFFDQALRAAEGDAGDPVGALVARQRGFAAGRRSDNMTIDI